MELLKDNHQSSSQEIHALKKQSELNHFLYKISKLVLSDNVDVDILVEKILLYGKKLVHADRSSFYHVDHGSSELYANLFDEGMNANGLPIFSRKPTLRFSMGTDIAGLVARTGKMANIKNASSDSNFNRDNDHLTGYTTHNILCMPIISHSLVIGIIQMINKKSERHGKELISSSGFTKTDEELFKRFTVYCSLALDYAKSYIDLQHMTAQASILDDITNFHTQCSPAEVKPLMNTFHLKEVPIDLDSFYFYGPNSHEDHLLQIYVHMLDNLFGQDFFNKTKLCNFLTTVKKNYRPVSYHSWRHGWNVAHCVYCILIRVKDTGLISNLHMQALMISSLCHDLDHRGYNNAFYDKYKKPLAVLYAESTMEYHHYNVTLSLLQREENNIFCDMNREDYQKLLGYMKHCILATDIGLYFANQKQLARLIDSQSLNLQDPAHLDEVLALVMTSCDLSVVCKSWEDYQSSLPEIYNEFYNQGDEEKAHGDKPMPMLDRNNVENIPKDQVGFYRFICMPCYQTLTKILPETSDLLVGCEQNKDHWQSISEDTSSEVWEIPQSLTKKLYDTDNDEDLCDIVP